MKKILVLVMVMCSVALGALPAYTMPDDVTIQTLANFQSNETWTPNASASVAADTDAWDIITGTQSLRMTVADGANGVITLNVSPTINAWANIGLYLKVDDVSSVSSVIIYFHDSANGYRNLSLTGTGRAIGGASDNEWVLFQSRADMTNAAGTPAGAAWGTAAAPTFPIMKIRIQVVAAGGNVNINFGHLFAYQPAKAYAVLFFDDGYTSVHDTTFPKLRAAGFKACAALVPSLVAGAGFMTVSQAQTLRDNRWDVVSHTWANTSFSNTGSEDYPGIILDPNKVAYNLRKSKQWMIDNGFAEGANYLVWPHNQGYTSNWNAADISQTYHLAARGRSSRPSVGAAWSAAYVTNKPSGYVPFDWQSLPYFSLGETTRTDFTTDGAKAFLDDVIACKQVALIYSHRVQAEPTSIDISPEYLDGLIAYLKQNSANIEVITLSEWYNKVNGIPEQRVTAPWLNF